MYRDIFGKQALFSWWHGKGGLLDYTNQAAKQWWHGQMDKVCGLRRGGGGGGGFSAWVSNV